MQIGQSAIIAQESALPVVSDFRVADMAANGHGAPLVPAADKLLFAKKGKWIALQNIGGMANVTLLPPVEKNEAVVAFDTGPGNALIDLAVLEMSKGQQSYDKGGQIAKRGKIIPSLLNWLEKIPYLSEKPPKSTGRELFGEELFRKMLQRAAVKKAKAEDLVSTLTEFTVSTILSAYKDHLPVEPEEVYVAGGGARNRTLLRGLKQGLTVPVAPLGDRQLADFREALCFATLGYLFLLGKPGAKREATWS